MRKVLRDAGIGTAAVVAAIALTGCVNSEEPVEGGSASTGDAMAPLHGSSSSGSAQGSAKQARFGKACSRLPQADTGDLPAGKAIGKNPMLRSFASELNRSGLGKRLDRKDEHYTVFAPSDAALNEAGGQGGAQAGKLRGYVLDEQHDRTALLESKQFRTLAGDGKLSVEGSGSELTVTAPSGKKAKVVCGNIKAANATIYIVDSTF